MAMDVANDSYWRFDVYDIGLFHEEFLSLRTEGFKDRLGEEFFAVEAGDAGIEVDGSWERNMVLAMTF